MQPSNDNEDPFGHAETALAVLYHRRRELLAADTTGRPLSWWRERARVLAEFEEIERLCLEYL